MGGFHEDCKSKIRTETQEEVQVVQMFEMSFRTPSSETFIEKEEKIQETVQRQ